MKNDDIIGDWYNWGQMLNCQQLGCQHIYHKNWKRKCNCEEIFEQFNK